MPCKVPGEALAWISVVTVEAVNMSSSGYSLEVEPIAVFWMCECQIKKGQFLVDSTKIIVWKLERWNLF